ncbi:ATP-binding cassette domain-containing protein [Chlorobium sp. KB01]|uniref:ATP-binding cassette domain-containing protein n=1 Tax=Chlorobium sp. KB01 TaxID=1917528 RepID=UPI00097572ED|nr:ATP-binding cassette domain-containing protein [Chlorobium sp. KB01]
MSENALTFDNVSAGYKERVVLDGVSFAIAEGEFVSLIGPNGCGKSTLLKTAAALLKPLSGSVALFGQDVRYLKPAVRASLLGVVPQKIESPMAFTVSQIVMNGRISSIGPWGSPSSLDHDIVERSMIYTDVSELRERFFTELSGGEQQRVALAMVLAQEPKIIMLDESIAHLDINHRQEVLQILMNLNREKRMTILLVSHDLTLSAGISDRFLLMDKGSLIKAGTPAEVLQADLLSRVYNCELRVQQDPYTGYLQVSGAQDTLRRLRKLGKTVHVIAGGGSGLELYRRLLIEGYEVTTGVLNRLDSDAEAARALNIRAVLEQPFSPVGSDAISEASTMIDAADYVILSSVPFGSGNLVNLRLAEGALKSGKTVLLAAGIAGRDYTEGKAALALSKRMLGAGAVNWQTIPELMSMLQQHHTLNP